MKKRLLLLVVVSLAFLLSLVPNLFAAEQGVTD
jgi:hypothetical protein